MQFLVRSLAILVGLASLATVSHAHSYMSKPKTLFPEGYVKLNNYYGIIDTKQFTPTLGKFDAATGVDYMERAMKLNNTKTLRDFIADHVDLLTLGDGNKTFNGTGRTWKGAYECGMSLTTGAKQPLPDTINFPWSHPGPCEIWCDNTRILSNADCKGDGIKGKYPFDAAKCQGATLLQVILLGVHTPRMQVFTNCAPLEGGGAETDPKKVFKYRAATGDDDAAANDEDAATKAPVATPTPTQPSKCRVLRD